MGKRILLFGGAFDPPHLGHKLVITQALKQVLLDELWVMPCFGHTFNKKLAPVKNRVELARLLAMDCNDRRVKVDLTEIDDKLSGSTYETWQHLINEWPKHDFSFLMGSDNLMKFTSWKNWEKLLAAMNFYVYIRKGFEPKPWYPEMKLLNGVEISEVSSTMIRDRMLKRQNIEALVSPAIAAYIQQNNLYR